MGADFFLIFANLFSLFFFFFLVYFVSIFAVFFFFVLNKTKIIDNHIRLLAAAAALNNLIKYIWLYIEFIFIIWNSIFHFRLCRYRFTFSSLFTLVYVCMCTHLFRLHFVYIKILISRRPSFQILSTHGSIKNVADWTFLLNAIVDIVAAVTVVDEMVKVIVCDFCFFFWAALVSADSSDPVVLMWFTYHTVSHLLHRTQLHIEHEMGIERKWTTRNETKKKEKKQIKEWIHTKKKNGLFKCERKKRENGSKINCFIHENFK